MSKLLAWLEHGPPGWPWAGALTVSAIVQEFRGELSVQFAAHAGGLVAAWLGYKGWCKHNSKH